MNITQNFNVWSFLDRNLNIVEATRRLTSKEILERREANAKGILISPPPTNYAANEKTRQMVINMFNH